MRIYKTYSKLNRYNIYSNARTDSALRSLCKTEMGWVFIRTPYNIEIFSLIK